VRKQHSKVEETHDNTNISGKECRNDISRKAKHCVVVGD